MRRADRLFEIVQCLRGKRLVTAEQLADQLEVSRRTIYRDIADLQANNVPIDGERGVGYILRSGYDLPPLMFTRSELLSLVAGARFVRAWGGATMARAATEALIKIESVIPERDQDYLARVEVQVPGYAMSEAARQFIDEIEAAIEKRAVLDLAYGDAERTPTRRTVRPLSLWYWGKAWTLLGWCELREDFRLFRVDRIEVLARTDRTFRPEKGKTLEDFYAQGEAEGFPRAGLKL